MQFEIFLKYIILFLRFWPVIDDALRAAAIDRGVSVKLLISYWNHSSPAQDYFLHSLQAISKSYKNVDIQVVKRNKFFSSLFLCFPLKFIFICLKTETIHLSSY